MKSLLLGLALLCSSLIFSQPVDTAKKEIKKINGDSIVAALQKRRDSLMKAAYMADSNLRKQENRNNFDYILQLQKENRDKQRKAAMIRIALGVGFLVLLIVGLRRRSKTKSA